jgi:hypothetical protein
MEKAFQGCPGFEYWRFQSYLCKISSKLNRFISTHLHYEKQIDSPDPFDRYNYHINFLLYLPEQIRVPLYSLPTIKQCQ